MVQRLILLAVLAAAPALAGCASSDAVCAGGRIIRPSRSDVLTAGTIDQIVKNNRNRVAQGCKD